MNPGSPSAKAGCGWGRGGWRPPVSGWPAWRASGWRCSSGRPGPADAGGRAHREAAPAAGGDAVTDRDAVFEPLLRQGAAPRSGAGAPGLALDRDTPWATEDAGAGGGAAAPVPACPAEAKLHAASPIRGAGEGLPPRPPCGEGPRRTGDARRGHFSGDVHRASSAPVRDVTRMASSFALRPTELAAGLLRQRPGLLGAEQQLQPHPAVLEHPRHRVDRLAVGQQAGSIRTGRIGFPFAGRSSSAWRWSARARCRGRRA